MRLWNRERKITDLIETDYGSRYRSFFENNGFSLVDYRTTELASLPYIITLCKSDDVLLAFTSHMSEGENIRVALPGAPLDSVSIVNREHGWSLVGEVWNDFNRRRIALYELHSYPSKPALSEEVAAVDASLREFIELVRSGKVDVSRPRHRLERDSGIGDEPPGSENISV